MSVTKAALAKNEEKYPM